MDPEEKNIQPEPEAPESEDTDEDSSTPSGEESSRETVTEERFTRAALTSPPCILLGAAAILYLFLSLMMVDLKYIDFSDSNYLYISWRIAEGEVLYKDIPSPQPPLMFFLGGSLLYLNDNDPGLIRIWQSVQHALTAFCVAGIAWFLFRRLRVACWAGILKLFMPEGVWWAAGFNSESPMILLQCWSLLLLLSAYEKKKPGLALMGAAAISSLSCFINMTALPYAALQWFFVGYLHRHFLLRYSLSFIIPALFMLGFMMWYSSGEYFIHVFSRQIGTYPTESLYAFLSYAFEKLVTEGGDIIVWQGGFVFAAMAGMMVYAGHPKDEITPARPHAIWWGVFSIGSIIFVTKGGTVEYIFTIGEPAVAVFASYFFGVLIRTAQFPVDEIRSTWAQLKTPLPRPATEPAAPDGPDDEKSLIEKAKETIDVAKDGDYTERGELKKRDPVNALDAERDEERDRERDHREDEDAPVEPPPPAEAPSWRKEKLPLLGRLVNQPTHLGIITLIVCLAIPALVLHPAKLLSLTFISSSGPGGVFELSDREVRNVRRFIQSESRPDELILAPPHYAFFAQRKIVDNMSSLFILYMAYYNEWGELRSSRTLDFDFPTLTNPRIEWDGDDVQALEDLFLAEPELNETYPAIAHFLHARAMIRSGDVRLIVVNRAHQFFAVPPLADALFEYAIRFPDSEQLQLNTREERLDFFYTNR